MKKIDVGQTIQIIANVGVIAGIVLVAIQLRQNNEVLGVQMRANLVDRITGTADIVIENPDLLDLLARDATSLTQSEHDRLVLLGIRVLTTFETAFREVQRGLGDEATLRR